MLTLDPQISKILAADPSSTLDAANLAEMRAAGAAPQTRPSPGVERRDLVVSAGPGEPGVEVRVHRPVEAEGPLPAVYSIHGGGYVMGSFAADDTRLDLWARTYGCVGVSVNYRLSPETAYPGPLDDCYSGLAWLFEHHEELGVDPDRIGVAGTSAGAGLAAGLALLARDRGELPLTFQLLDAPMLDDRQQTPSSQRDDLVIFNRESNEFGWRSYLGSRYGSADIPPYAAAARAEDLSGLPPTYICVGDVDGFRDEAIDYALRLGQAGVPTELHVHPGAPHGVKHFADVPVAQRYTRGIHEWIGRQLTNQP